jgi:hypothetical protein
MSEVLGSVASESVSDSPTEIQARPASRGGTALPADCSVEERNERRYLEIINPLLAEAWQQHSMETLVDVLTWTLARVIVGLDKPHITGDILRRIGNYTCRIAESNRAEAEAEASKAEGHMPH